MRQRIVTCRIYRLLDHMTTYENVALCRSRVVGREESSYRREVMDLAADGFRLGDRTQSMPVTHCNLSRAVTLRRALCVRTEPLRTLPCTDKTDDSAVHDHTFCFLLRALPFGIAALEPPRPALACVLLCRFLQQVSQQPRNLSAGTSNKALRLRLGAGPLAFRLPPGQRASEKENSNVYLESAHNHRFHWQ